MKRILVLLAIVILFVVGCSMFVVNQGPSKQEMIEVLKSDEAILAIEEAMHNREIKALTQEGVIKEYMIDYNSVKWSPMGGIKMSIINNDNNLMLYYTLDKYNNKYTIGGSHASNELDELLESVYGK